jgi:hypothetical protein
MSCIQLPDERGLGRLLVYARSNSQRVMSWSLKFKLSKQLVLLSIYWSIKSSRSCSMRRIETNT